MRRLSGEFKIETLTERDGERYRAVRLEALEDTPDAFGMTLAEEQLLSLEDWKQRLANPDAVTFVAVAGGDDAGLVTGLRHWDHPDDAALVSMWVSPRARGRRIGGALIDRVINWARAKGFSAVRLEVADNNLPAIGLYEQQGFVPTGMRSTLPPPREFMRNHERILRLV